MEGDEDDDIEKDGSDERAMKTATGATLLAS